MHRDDAAFQAAEMLNTQCRCVTVDLTALRTGVEARLHAAIRAAMTIAAINR